MRRRLAPALGSIARATYSQPPAHGADIVEAILTDPDLTRCRRTELEVMRQRLTQLREGFVDALVRLTGDRRLATLAETKGMFLRLPLSPAQVEALRIRHAVYAIPSGRINLAGVPQARVEELARHVARVLAD